MNGSVHLTEAAASSGAQSAAREPLSVSTEAERRFQDLVEGAVQGILIHRDGQPLFLNRAWAALHGYTVEEVYGLGTVLPLIAPHERERVFGYMRAHLRGELAPSRYEYEGVCKDGSPLWLETVVRQIPWEGRPAVQSTTLDISQRKQAEARLQRLYRELEDHVAKRTAELLEANQRLRKEIADRERAEQAVRDSEALYHSLVDTLAVCVLRKDLEGRFTFANRAFLELMELQPQDVIGKTDYELYPRELAEKYRRDDRRVIETGESFEDVEQNDQEGQTHWVRVRKSPVYDSQRRVVGVQAIFWDVTERKLAEEEIRLKNRDLEALLYVISHDLREPLRAIEAFSKLIADRYTERLDERGREFLKHVVAGSQRMHQLLEDVLLLSRAQRMAPPSESVDSREIVADVLRELQLKLTETHATVTVADDLPHLRVDRRWATQAVYNLVANALKFTRPGVPPHVEIRAYRPQPGEPAGTGLVIRDHGPGLDPQHVVRIFDLFQRAVGREVEGTGAGLAIVRQVAERHGGRAWARTNVPDGAEFVVTFGRTEAVS